MLDNITQAIQDVIDQPEAKVKVQRWFPGVVTEIIEEVNEKSNTNITQRLSNTNITQRLLTEASSALERKQLLQTNATKEKTLEEIMGVDAEKGQGSGPEVDATAEQSPESGVTLAKIGVHESAVGLERLPAVVASPEIAEDLPAFPFSTVVGT